VSRLSSRSGWSRGVLSRALVPARPGSSRPPAAHRPGPAGERLRVATYNIHKGRGLDGRVRLERILEVLAEVDADIVALQEVLAPHAEVLARGTGMHAAFGPTRELPSGPYGNLCLSRFPLVGHARFNLTCRPFEPRGCLRADVDLGGRPLHVFNVHLGLNYRERILQAVRLARFFERGDLPGGRVVLGDFNEWFHGRASRVLHARLGPPCGRRRGVRTHPSPLPVFPLDRIYHDDRLGLERVRVHRSRLARVASDHLPTYADFRVARIPPAAPAGGGPA
jgi:endonuclease/exonuclease/phosphatase family metal-dependent hydrolase